MHTWKVGRDTIFFAPLSINNNLHGDRTSSISVQSRHLARVDGSAVFFVGTPRGTPIALLHHVKANRSLHRTVVLLLCSHGKKVPLSFTAANNWLLVAMPWVKDFGGRSPATATCSRPTSGNCSRASQERQVPLNPAWTTCFIFSREMIITGGNAPLWEWQKRLYRQLSRNANPVKDYYQLPPSQIIEIGLPLQI